MGARDSQVRSVVPWTIGGSMVALLETKPPAASIKSQINVVDLEVLFNDRGFPSSRSDNGT